MNTLGTVPRYGTIMARNARGMKKHIGGHEPNPVSAQGSASIVFPSYRYVIHRFKKSRFYLFPQVSSYRKYDYVLIPNRNENVKEQSAEEKKQRYGTVDEGNLDQSY
ncbi:MAG: hypothetical protein M1431_00725 [Candidatus Thermoplasmatota archaeon]|nr:hypothetical protein [Candidatus Thermoplasmatota archaeon]